MRKSIKISTLIAILAAILSFNVFGQTTSLVSIDGSGHLTYTPDENGNVLPDFSYVGYHHGEKPIPDVPVARTISPVAGDNRTHIQAAIDEVAALPADVNGHKGAVLLNAGLYKVAGTIFMRSGVVLRGVGNTTIIRAVFTTQDPLISVSSGDSPGYTLTGSTKKMLTDAYVPFGARTFTIESGHSFNVGDRVVLQRQPTQTWVDLIGTDNVAPNPPWTIGGYTVDFFRVIKAIDGNSITIDAPVMDHIYSGIANGYLYKYDNTLDYKTEIGIENMSLESSYSNESALDHSHTAIAVHAAENGWVRNVDTYHFTYSAVAFSNGAYKWTVDNCRYLRPVGILNSGTRYSFGVSGGAHQILIQNCFSDFGRHDFVTGSRTPGPSVFSNCVAVNCWNVSGPHHRWDVGILYDRVYTDLDLNVENRTDSGSGHGWAGANHVMWNCSTYSRMVLHDPPTDANNWAIGCIANPITGVGRKATEPLGLVESEGIHINDIPSLYRAQLNDRLGAGTASTDHPFPGFTVDQKVYPDELTITSAVAGSQAEHHGIIRLAEHSYDNDVQTRWASDIGNSDVSKSWIEYTLDGTYEIYQIKLQLFNSWIRTYPLKIEVDGKTVFTGTSQLTEEMGWNNFSFSPVSGSKVKISMTVKNSFGVTELCMHETKIYGSNDSLSTYQLTVNSGTGDGNYVDSSNVSITAYEAPDGKEFDQWTGDTAAIADIYSASTTVIMPASDAQVNATYHNLYNITVNSGNGDGIYAPRTDVVITADKTPIGQIFDQWTGNIATITDIYSPSTTLTMPASDVQVTPVYKSPVTINALDDAYVRGAAYADSNFGSEPIIEIKNRPGDLTEHREGFIKFDLSSIPETLSSAILQLYVKTNTGGTRHSCSFVEDDSWTETGITYNNKPGVGAAIDNQGVPSGGYWIEFDVTNQVKTEILGDGNISLQISDDRENVYITYDSKEGANPPVLAYGAPGGSNNFTISASAGSNGSITPGGSFIVTEGSDQTFYFVADPGFEIKDVLVDDTSAGAVNSYTFTNVTRDHTISASFVEIITHTITASAGPYGSLTPVGSVEVVEGKDQTFTITADEGFKIEDVMVDGSSIGAVSSYTFTIVTGNHTISASFIELTYSITASAGANGSITPGGNITVAEGSDQTFFITADPGYAIEDVLVDGASIGAVNRYTFSNVTVDHTISVNFVQKTHSITASAGANGSITPEGSITVAEGSDHTYSIIADSGYAIEVVLVDGASVGVVSSYTFSNVKADHSIAAEFIPDSTNVSDRSEKNTTQTNTSIKIFPNPTNGKIYISGIEGEANVRIFDLLGKQLKNMRLNGNNAFDLSTLNAGIYFIEVYDNNKSIIELLIKE